jgi:hypothetical protein
MASLSRPVRARETFGFSAKPTTTGWGPERTARAWVTLIKRLGYTQFVAQGGDHSGRKQAQDAMLHKPQFDQLW